MQKLHVDTPDKLHDLCTQLKTADWIALDTEFMRERTYFPKLCLVQVATPELAASVDPLAVQDLSALIDILCDERIVKVLHAARQDLEIFHHYWKRIPQPIFDTQIAATLTGMGDQIGYGALIKDLLQRDLDKDQARTDWSRRPLAQDQLRYALDDVIYLGEAYEMLRSRLQSMGREEWPQKDFEALTDTALYAAEPDLAWQRIRGRVKLRSVQLAVLRRLATWRETTAIELDKPRQWITRDEVLVDIARRLPGDHAQLERIRNIDRGMVKRHGQMLLEIIEAEKQKPGGGRPGKESTDRLTPAQDLLVDILACAVKARATEQHLTPSALAPRKDLESLVLGGNNPEVLKGWRLEMVGRDLQAIVKGEISLRVRNGHIELQQNTGAE